jgi:hypothetical protein
MLITEKGAIKGFQFLSEAMRDEEMYKPLFLGQRKMRKRIKKSK